MDHLQILLLHPLSNSFNLFQLLFNYASSLGLNVRTGFCSLLCFHPKTFNYGPTYITERIYHMLIPEASLNWQKNWTDEGQYEVIDLLAEFQVPRVRFELGYQISL